MEAPRTPPLVSRNQKRRLARKSRKSSWTEASVTRKSSADIVTAVDPAFRVRQLIRDRRGVENLTASDVEEVFTLYAVGDLKLEDRTITSKEVAKFMEVLAFAQYLLVHGAGKSSMSIVNFWQHQAHLSPHELKNAADLFVSLMDPLETGKVSYRMFLSSFHSAFHSYITATAAGRCTRVYQWQPPKSQYRKMGPQSWLGMDLSICSAATGLWTFSVVSLNEGVLKLKVVDLDDQRGFSIPVFPFRDWPFGLEQLSIEELCAHGIRKFCVSPKQSHRGVLTVCFATITSLVMCTNDKDLSPETDNYNLDVLNSMTLLPLNASPATNPSIVNVTFSETGDHLIALTSEENDDDWPLRVWDVASQELVMIVVRDQTTFADGRGFLVTNCGRTHTVLPGGKVAVGLHDGSVAIYTLKCKRADETEPTIVSAPDATLSFPDDGTALFIKDENEPVTEPGPKRFPVTCMLVTPSGELVSNGGIFNRRSLAIWSLQTGTLLRSFSTGDDAIHSLCLAPDNKHVLAASTTFLTIWNIGAGIPFVRRLALTSMCKSIGLSRDGERAVTISQSFDERQWQFEEWNVGGFFFPELQVRRFLWAKMIPDVVNVIIDFLR